MKVDTPAEQLFFTTIRVDTIDQAGNPGSGTAFAFGYSKSGQEYPFVVTNKHVVAGMKQGALTFLKQVGDQPSLGDRYQLTLGDWSTGWFGHPSQDVDVSIYPLAPIVEHLKQEKGIDVFYRMVPSNMIPTAEQEETLDAVEPVMFIGYPNGVWDTKNFLPVARQGTTASPITVDFENTPRFLIDASVFGGSSGSPVFLMTHGTYNNRKGSMVLGTRFFFLGVVAAVFYRTQFNEIVAVPIPTAVQPMAKQQEMIDLGIVFKARTVVETIEAFLKAHNVT